MDEKEAITADTLELLIINQTAIRAALEEVSLWVSLRGSAHIHDNVMLALATLDMHSETICLGIERLRS